MHYDDLISRLRQATKLPMLQALMNEAADAIEELYIREKHRIKSALRQAEYEASVRATLDAIKRLEATE